MLIAAAVAVTVISACGPAGKLEEPTQRLAEVNVSVRGGPLTPTGQVERQNAVVIVHDADGGIVKFDGSNVMRSDGDRTELAVDSSGGALTLYLAEGETFSFGALAYDRDGNVLSAGTGRRVVTGASSNASVIRLVSIMGALQLTPRLPTTFVVPGQELDLTFSVSSAGRTDLRVPERDYSVEYTVTNGTALAPTSGRGMRIRIGDRVAGDVGVQAHASGLVIESGGATEGVLRADLRLQFNTALVVDTEPPTVSDLAFDAEQQAFTGVSSDNLAVSRVTLWDGPVLLATTDLQDVSDIGLPEIVFPGGGTAFLTYLNLPAGSYALSVVSADYTGNETSLDIAVTVQ